MTIDFGDCPCTGKNMSSLTAPWILMTLYNHQGTHGYEIKKIINRYVEDLGIDINITGLYRHLNMLEERGVLSSEWSIQGKGPARRKYFLTEAGNECLWNWINTLCSHASLIGRFFDHARDIFPPASLPKIQFNE